MAEEAIVSSPTETSSVEIESEKMLPQSEVNRIVSGVRKERYEKGYNDAYHKAKAEMSQAAVAPIVDDAVIEKKVAEIVAKKQQEQIDAANKAAYAQLQSQVSEKVQEASARIPDYNQVISEAGLDVNTQVNVAIMHYGNQVDNSGDVFYELGKSTSKLANLTSLITTGNDAAAKKYIKELSAAIKSNKNSDFKAPPSPLSSLKPSAIGADSSNESDMIKAMRAAQVKHRV